MARLWEQRRRLPPGQGTGSAEGPLLLLLLLLLLRLLPLHLLLQLEGQLLWLWPSRRCFVFFRSGGSEREGEEER